VTIRVAIVDDQELVRAGFSLLVDSEDDMTVVAAAGDGVAATRIARQHQPDVILMDIRMAGGDGITATRVITTDPACQHTRIIAVTTFDLDEYVFGALRAGASGFLLKSTRPADLVTAIRTVVAGDALLAPAAARKLIAAYRQRPAPDYPIRDIADLTDREREVLGLVGLGRSNQEICTTLHISMATTKTHIGRLLAKLDARDRAQLVIAAYQSGLVC
jgi:DNA-binding NarL/FixJ family response regulator